MTFEVTGATSDPAVRIKQVLYRIDFGIPSAGPHARLDLVRNMALDTLTSLKGALDEALGWAAQGGKVLA